MGRRVDPRDHPAAPTDKAITPPNPPLAYKTIQKLEDWAYEVYDDDSNKEVNGYMVQDTYPDVEESQFQTIVIHAPSFGPDTIDELIYFDVGTSAANVLAVTNARNKEDDKHPPEEKLPMRDIILAFWVIYLGRAARDLNAIIYYSVVEPALSDRLFQFIYGLMGQDILTDLVLNREAESPQERRAFSLLLEEAPFCIGVNKMLQEFEEFAGVNIQSFEFLPVDAEIVPSTNKPPFNFRIKFS